MTEIKSLDTQITNETDKILFYESIKCLESKTFRSGYIISWISIVESLKRKISDLANTGDKQSQDSLKKIESLESKHKSADVQIIEEALRISLIENEDYTKLEFFWNQRCLFAHPYEKAPSEDELIFIIKQSINLTLGRKLEFKKNYIDQLIDNLINKPHFLAKDENSIRIYAQKAIPRIAKNLHSYFFKVLIAKIGDLKDNESKKVFLLRLRIFSHQLLKYTEQDISDNKFRMEDLALDHTYEFALGTCEVEIWEKLSIRVRNLILEYVVQDQENHNNEHFVVIRILSDIYKNELFCDSHEQKFLNLINNINIIQAFDFYQNDSKLVTRLIGEFNSGDFYRQQDSILALKSDDGQEFQDRITINQSIDIGRRITKASEYGCYEAQDSLNNPNYRFSDNFKPGFIVGMFVENNMEFRLSDRMFSKLNYLIDNVSDTELQNCLNYINEFKTVDNHPIGMNDFHLKDFEKKIELIEQQNIKPKRSINFLKDVLNEYF